MAVKPRDVGDLLKDAFAAKHVTAAVKHFNGCVEEFGLNKWDDASAKGGKFIEAALKASAVTESERGTRFCRTRSLATWHRPNRFGRRSDR